MRLINYCLYLLFVACVCGACNTNGNVVFEQNIPIDEGVWNKDNVATIVFQAADTIDYYDLQLYVRNRNDYPYSNLYLFVTVTAPTGAIVTDTVQYTLADDHGKWLGKGGSQFWDNRFPFRYNVRFAAKGDYTFQIRQGMRNNELPGIVDVGVRVLEREN